MTALQGNNISPLKGEWKCLAAGQKSREVKIIDVMSFLRKPLSVQCEVIYDVGNAVECLDSFAGVGKASPFAHCSLASH